MMKFIGGTAVVVAVVAVTFMSAGCDTSGGNPHGLSGVDVPLDDGRTVTCVQNARGNVLSCDWDHAAVKSYPTTDPHQGRSYPPTVNHIWSGSWTAFDTIDGCHCSSQDPAVCVEESLKTYNYPSEPSTGVDRFE